MQKSCTVFQNKLFSLPLFFIVKIFGVMKRIAFITISAALLAGLYACSGNFAITKIEAEQSIALSENGIAFYNIKINYELPAKGYNELCETINEEVLGDEYENVRTSEMAARYINNQATIYRNTNLRMLRELGLSENEVASLNWEESITGNFMPQSHNIISYKIEKYTYTGGAHGMPVEKYLNFRAGSYEEIDEDDIFKDNSEDVLTAALTAKAQAHLTNSDGVSTLYVNQVEPCDNFFVSNEGITFVYNPYEIAPYSEGKIELTLSWDELKALNVI